MHVATLFQQAHKTWKRKLWEAALYCEELTSFSEKPYAVGQTCAAEMQRLNVFN